MCKMLNWKEARLKVRKKRTDFIWKTITIQVIQHVHRLFNVMYHVCWDHSWHEFRLNKDDVCVQWLNTIVHQFMNLKRSFNELNERKDSINGASKHRQVTNNNTTWIENRDKGKLFGSFWFRCKQRQSKARQDKARHGEAK